MTENPDTSRNDLSKLEDTYEILSTLQEDRASTTYLARHRELGRDVTITVVHMPDGGANNTLTHFASDARLLSSARHDTIVPVIEGRWLDDDRFAVVRVLARGTTLTETLATSGPFAQERAAELLEQVSQGLQWARESGVVHRTVASDSVGFQQGSGRVMMSLGLSPLPMDSLPDACADAQTIGALAWSMLTGRSYDLATTDDRTLGDLRPRLSSKVVEATEALLACKRGSDAPDIGEYINLLRTEQESPLATPAAPTPIEAEPVFANVTPRPKALPAASASVAGDTDPRVIMTPDRSLTPVGSAMHGDAPVVVRSRFRTPIAAALVMVALTVVAVLAVLRAQGRDVRTMIASGDIDRSLVGGSRPSPMEAPPPPLPAGSAQPPAVPIDTPPPSLYPNQIPGTAAPQQPSIPTSVLPYSQLQTQPTTPPVPTSPTAPPVPTATGALPTTPSVPTSPTAPPVPTATGALPTTPPVPTSPTAPPVPTSTGAMPTTPPVPTSSMTSRPLTQPAVSQPAAPQPAVTQVPAPTSTQPPPVRPMGTVDSAAAKRIDTAVTPKRVDTATTAKRADTTATEKRSSDQCSSSNPDDQQACFSAAKARNDTELNRVYGDVIASMRRRANVGDSDPDPDTVRELRAAQRRWVDERDSECRRRGEGREGAQWAQSRAQCFAEFAAERSRVLLRMRDSVP